MSQINIRPKKFFGDLTLIGIRSEIFLTVAFAKPQNLKLIYLCLKFI